MVRSFRYHPHSNFHRAVAPLRQQRRDQGEGVHLSWRMWQEQQFRRLRRCSRRLWPGDRTQRYMLCELCGAERSHAQSTGRNQAWIGTTGIRVAGNGRTRQSALLTTGPASRRINIGSPTMMPNSALASPTLKAKVHSRHGGRPNFLHAGARAVQIVAGACTS